MHACWQRQKRTVRGGSRSSFLTPQHQYDRTSCQAGGSPASGGSRATGVAGAAAGVRLLCPARPPPEKVLRLPRRALLLSRVLHHGPATPPALLQAGWPPGRPGWYKRQAETYCDVAGDFLTSEKPCLQGFVYTLLVLPGACSVCVYFDAGVCRPEFCPSCTSEVLGV